MLKKFPQAVVRYHIQEPTTCSWGHPVLDLWPPKSNQWVQVNCTRCNEISYWQSKYITFTEMWGHCDLDLWFLVLKMKSKFKWMFLPNVKEIPRGFPEISHSQGKKRALWGHIGPLFVPHVMKFPLGIPDILSSKQLKVMWTFDRWPQKLNPVIFEHNLKTSPQEIKWVNPWVQVKVFAKWKGFQSHGCQSHHPHNATTCFVGSPWPWPFTTKIDLVHPWVQVNICTKFEEKLQKSMFFWDQLLGLCSDAQ